MELRDIISILFRRKWIVIVATLITVIVVTIGSFILTPLYASSTTLRVGTAAQGTVDSLRYDISYADRLMNTYIKMISSAPFLDELDKQLGIDKPPQIDVENIANTELLRITVTDPDPQLAQKAADTLANLLITRVRESDPSSGKTALQMLSEQLNQVQDEINTAKKQYDDLLKQIPNDTDRINAANRSMQLKEQTYATLLAQYEQVRISQGLRTNTVSIIDPAKLPDQPVFPNKKVNLVVSLALGLISGMGLAFLTENLDTTLYTNEQIQKETNLNILGSIPTASSKAETFFFDGSSPEGEAFRRVRANLVNLDRDAPLGRLLMTSSEPGEGKSLVTANLAYSFAQAGQKVLVIDCDLRHPAVHKVFNLPNQRGLSTLLKQEATLPEVVQFSKNTGVWVIPSGPPLPNPSEWLGSSQMKNLIEQLLFNIILLDSPSLLAVGDATELIPYVDGVVMVVERARARQSTVRSSLQILQNIKARLLGVIINHAELDIQYHY